MIWVYAIADRPDLPLPRGHGITGTPLEGVAAGPLLAVVTRHDHAPAEPAPDALWAHERAVELVMAERAVLPMRFGTTQADDEALRAALGPRREELCAALDHVRGRVELGVRAATADGARGRDDDPASGREWLERRIAGDRLATAVHEPLARLAVAERRRAAGAPGEVLRAAYLVDRGSLERFAAAVERLQRDMPHVDVLCTGPWPPYSFVSAPEPAEVAP